MFHGAVEQSLQRNLIYFIFSFFPIEAPGNGDVLFNFLFDPKTALVKICSVKICFFYVTFHARSTCDAADFAVPVGKLRLEGPRTNQEVTCSVGQHCILNNIQSVGAIPGDRIMVLAGCGIGPGVAGFPAGSIADYVDSWHGKDFRVSHSEGFFSKESSRYPPSPAFHCTHTYTHAHKHTYIHTHTQADTDAHTQTHTDTNAIKHTHIHICMYIHIRIHIYIYTHSHPHIAHFVQPILFKHLAHPTPSSYAPL